MVERILTSCQSLFRGRVQSGYQGCSQIEANLEMQVENARLRELLNKISNQTLSELDILQLTMAISKKYPATGNNLSWPIPKIFRIKSLHFRPDTTEGREILRFTIRGFLT